MVIKKIVFRNLSSSLTYLAFGGIRFYNKDNSVIASGSAITQAAQTGEFTNFLINANLTPYSDVYYPSYAFDTSKPQTGVTGSSTGNFYWLTSSLSNGTLTCTFKTGISSINRIEFNPRVSTSVDRGVTGNFIIDAYDDNNVLIHSYSVTPISTNDTIQNLDTPELAVSVKHLIRNSNKINTIIGENKYSNTVVPIMTSNTLPNGVASASNIYSTTYEAWKAFNGVPSQNVGWLSLDGTPNGWLAYEFVSAVQINKYKIYPRNYTGGDAAAPKNWTFEGTNDGITWTILDTKTNIINWNVTIPREYIFSNTQSYKKYRINVSANNGGSYVAIAQLQLMIITERPVLTIFNITSPTQEQFNSLGINDLKKYSEQSDRVSYEMNESINLDDGKVLRKLINKNTFKIKGLEVK